MIRSLISGGSALVGGGVAQIGVSFAANLALVRIISPDGFGTYALTVSLASAILTIVSLRLVTLIIREPQTSFTLDAIQRYCGALLVETSLATMVTLAAIYTSGTMSWRAVIATLTVAATHILGTLKAFYERDMAYGRLALMETSVVVLTQAGAVGLAFAGAGDTALYCRDAAAVILGAVGLRILGGLPFYRPCIPTAAGWRRLLAAARGVWLDGVLEGLFQRVTILLAGMAGGTREAGLFFQAQRLAIAPHLILSPIISRAAMTWISRLEDSTKQKHARNQLIVFTGVPLVLAAGSILVFAEPIVSLLLGPSWEAVAPLLQALAGAMIFISLFETIKVFCSSYCPHSNIALSRFAQYAALGLWVALGPFLSDDPVLNLCWAMSLAFAAAFVVGSFLVAHSERQLPSASR